MRDGAHDREVVADEEIGEPALALEADEERKDAGHIVETGPAARVSPRPGPTSPAA